MLVCDFHVHLHSCFSSERLFDDAYERSVHCLKNGGDDLCQVMLVIVDMGKTRHFADICASRFLSPGWHVDDAESGCACLSKGNRKMHIVQGWQGNTLERLEYIALGAVQPPIEGCSLAETITSIQQAGGIPVIPWGAGKWLGHRGKVLRSFLQAGTGLFCLGDNGGRPYGWGESVHFKIARERGIPILPGSDPLPFAGDQQRIGSYCGVLADSLAEADIMASLKSAIAQNQPVGTVGSRISPYAFFHFQFKLRQAAKFSRRI